MSRRDPGRHSDARKGEQGAILPLFALSFVVLLGFAALAIDLGAAWSQRTLNQSAADGGVMAGAVSFIGGEPGANLGLVAEVEEFVDANLGYKISGAGVLGGGAWATCVDPEVVAGNFAPLKAFNGTSTAVINPCVSLSVGASEHGEKTLRVYLPGQELDTAFAGLVGVDTLTVGGFAEAEMDFAVEGGALPFVVPSGVGGGDEYCIGEMPPGLASGACDGSSKGKRNDIISPWHGTTDPGTPACTGDSVDPDLLGWNIALGIDHLLRTSKLNNSGAWLTAYGEDVCAARDSGQGPPYALRLGSGGEDDALIEGFAGEPQFGSNLNAPGRLRQGTGDTRYIDGNQSTDPHNMHLDNVGLWEYLFKDGIASTTNKCDGDNAAFAADGATATAAMEACLASKPTTQIFSDDILDSPRLTIMPQLHVNQSGLDALGGSSSFVNIKSFIPGFINKTFWNCSSSDDGKKTTDANDVSIECALTFQTYEDEATQSPNDIIDDRQWFAPGEGDADACLVSSATGNPKCKNNPNIAMRGVTVIVLDPDWLPESAVPGGDDTQRPISVSLSR